MWHTIINNRQKRARRSRKALFAGAVLLALAAAATDTATAAPVPGPITVVTESNTIHDPADTVENSATKIDDQASPLIELDFDGIKPGSEAIQFTMDRVIVPGDQITQSIRIKNAADADGILTIAAAAEQAVLTDTVASSLADDLQLSWEIGQESGVLAVNDLLDGKPHQIARIPLALGQTVTASVTIGMDETATGHNQGAGQTPAIEITTLATLTRVDENAEPSPTGSPTATESPSPTTPGGVDPSATGEPTDTQSPTPGTPSPGQEPSTSGEPSGTGEPTSDQPPIQESPTISEQPTDPSANATTTPPSQSGITGVLANTGTTWKLAALAFVMLCASAFVQLTRYRTRTFYGDESKIDKKRSDALR